MRATSSVCAQALLTSLAIIGALRENDDAESPEKTGDSHDILGLKSADKVVGGLQRSLTVSAVQQIINEADLQPFHCKEGQTL